MDQQENHHVTPVYMEEFRHLCELRWKGISADPWIIDLDRGVALAYNDVCQWRYLHHMKL